ncbi:MAG: hypothetical protein HZB26_20185 [Candidatus Hydrogenedentes bacterium]|nr:hypothetical protein [Candidatus Hydrogenedentota bacterium]
MWDRSLTKTSADGFCPEDARYIFAAEDFGAVWYGLEQSDAWKSLCQEIPSPDASTILHIRKTVGIRPFPARWSTWMGHRFLAARSPDGLGVCVYPGLLLRTASRLRAALGYPTDADGVGRYSEYAYGWREGFLIVSTSSDYVRAALRAPAPRLAQSNGRDELRVLLPSAHDALIRFRARDGWPIEGQLRVKTTTRKSPLTLANAWPNDPLCSISAPRWTDIRAVLELFVEPLHGLPGRDAIGAFATSLGQRWALGSLAADWDEQMEECSLALTSIDTSEAVPVPSLALLLRNASPQAKTHPLAPVLAPLAPTPYDWNGQRGVAAPLLGNSLNLCLCRSGTTWIAATNEPLMAVLAGKLKSDDNVDADLAVRLNWKKLSSAAEEVVENAGAHELFPGMNKADVDKDVLPFAKAIAYLGTLQLEARNQGAMLEFNGYLARSPTRMARPVQ